MSDRALHWFLVGDISQQAAKDIEAIGGVVHLVNEQLFPSLAVVALPYPAFEVQDFYAVRIRAGGKSFIWSGHHPGPEWTSAGDTRLRSEIEPYADLDSLRPTPTLDFEDLEM